MVVLRRVLLVYDRAFSDVPQRFFLCEFTKALKHANGKKAKNGVGDFCV